jgi:hypothetical protein
MTAKCKGCGGPPAPVEFWTESSEGVVATSERLCVWCWVERKNNTKSAGRDMRRVKGARAARRAPHPACVERDE